MKILFVTHYVELYGANRSLLNLLKGLSRYKVNFQVLSPRDGPIADKVKELGGSVIFSDIGHWAMAEDRYNEYSLNGKLYLLRKQLRFLSGTEFLLRPEIRCFSPDVVYTNSSVCTTGYVISKKLQVPHVWHIREFVYEDYRMRFILGKFIASKVIKKSSAVIAISESLRRSFFGKRYSPQVHVVYNGVISHSDIARYNSASVSQTGVLRLLILGFIHAKKGQETAIQAIQKVNLNGKRVILDIVGDGDCAELDRLRQLTKDLKVDDSVKFLGYSEDPFSLYANYDGLIMASKMEAMGRVTAEAMIMGLPVIGRNSGATVELIKNGQTGYLFSAGAEGFADAIERVLENRLFWRQMGENAKKYALSRFTEEIYSEKISKILNKLFE